MLPLRPRTKLPEVEDGLAEDGVLDYRRVRTNQRAPWRADLFLASAVPVIGGRSTAPLHPKAMYGSSASRRVNRTSIVDAAVHRPLLNRSNTVVSCSQNTGIRTSRPLISSDKKIARFERS